MSRSESFFGFGYSQLITEYVTYSPSINPDRKLQPDLAPQPNPQLLTPVPHSQPISTTLTPQPLNSNPYPFYLYGNSCLFLKVRWFFYFCLFVCSFVIQFSIRVGVGSGLSLLYQKNLQHKKILYQKNYYTK